MKHTLLAVLVSLALAGCASVKQEQVVVTKRVFVDLPFGFTTAVEPPKPPSLASYAAASESDREKLLIDNIQEQMDFIDFLVIERVSLKKWALEQKSIYELSPPRP